MSKVSGLRVVANDDVDRLSDLPGEVRLALGEAAASAREGLRAMSVTTGLKVMAAMMDAEIIDLSGPRCARPGPHGGPAWFGPVVGDVGGAAGAGGPAPATGRTSEDQRHMSA